MESGCDALHLEGAESGGLRLRLATEADLPEVVRMLLDPSTLAAIGETAEEAERDLHRLWQERPETSDLRHLVAERVRGREVIAYLRLEYPFNEPACLWLMFLCVAPRSRRQSNGRRIMELLVAEARRSGAVATFGLHTHATNAAAVKLYEATGFTCTKREPWPSRDGEAPERLTFCRRFGEMEASTSA